MDKREKEWAEKSFLNQEKQIAAAGTKTPADGSAFSLAGASLVHPDHDPRVNDLSWRHCIPLPAGQITPGTKDTARDLREFQWPDNLFEGKTVIDIGACDGFFSFHAEQQGAKKVLAVDPYRWTLDDRWSGQKGFNLAREILDSKVEDSVMPLEDLSRETVGTWEVGLFLGVFYHLVNPIQILKNVCDVVTDTIVIETINAEFWSLRMGAHHTKINDGEIQLDPFMTGQPMLTYYPTDEIDGDYTTWYAPNPAYIHAFLETEGFKEFMLRRTADSTRFVMTAKR